MAINKRFASEEYVNENYAPISHPHSWADSGEKITYSDTLTWDGNTEGLEVGTYYNSDDNKTYKLFRISDATPTFDELVSNRVFIARVSGDVTEMTVDTIYNVDDKLTDIDGFAYIVYDDDIKVQDGSIIFSLPKKGVYVHAYADNQLNENVSSITINGYNGFPTGEIVPLPNKYLDIIETVGSDTLTWDGDTTGLYCVANVFYRVSDAVPTLEELQNGGSYVHGKNGFAFTADNVMNLSEYGMGNNSIIITDGSGGYYAGVALAEGATATISGISVTFRKAGVFFLCEGDNYTRSLTINNYQGFKDTRVKTEYAPSKTVLYANSTSEYLYKNPAYTNKVTRDELLSAKNNGLIEIEFSGTLSSISLMIGYGTDVPYGKVAIYTSFDGSNGGVASSRTFYTAEFVEEG